VPPETRRPSRLPGDLRWAVALGAVFVWLWRVVDPSRTWYGAGLTSLPSFSSDPVFLDGHLATIGGPLAYAAAWLSQWLASSLAGAAMLTVAAGAGGLGAEWLGRQLARQRLPAFRYGPLLLAAYLDGQYLHLLDWQLGWALALLAAAGLLALGRRVGPAWVRLTVELAALALLYYLLGGPALLAALVLAVAELGWPSALLLAWMALLPWLSTRCGFDRPLREAYAALKPPALVNDAHHHAVWVWAAMLSLVLVASGVAVRVAARARPLRPWRTSLAWASLAAGLALLAGYGGDRVQGLRLDISRHTERGEWQAALAAVDKLRPVDLTLYEDYGLLLSLAHLGRTGDALFVYGLPLYSFLHGDPRLGPEDQVLRILTWHGLQLCGLELELGLVNTAEHGTHESLENLGTYPQLLVTMARIQVLQQRPEAAAVFLRLAADQPGDPVAAAPLLRALTADPTLAADPVQTRLASYRITNDIWDRHSVTQIYEEAAHEHPENDLAREYLLSWYLMTGQVDLLVAELAKLPRHGDQPLPRHYEEAALCHEVMVGHPVDLGPWTIRPATRRRFQQFVEAFGGDEDEVGALLRATHRPNTMLAKVVDGPWFDTYYYYLLFGRAGVLR
jgi:hypothetical protein